MYGEIIVYNIIAIIFTVQGINMRGFTKVSGVSETTHIGAVIQEIPNLRSQLDCARRCEPVSCISFSWNQQSKVCRAYNEELCDRGEPFLSPYLNYFVRDVREHIGVLRTCGNVDTKYCTDVYSIGPTLLGDNFDVLCDMDSADGPWTVIQRRYDGSESFTRQWQDYKVGFGNLTGEFWLGNDNIHELTQRGVTLRIELEGWDGTAKFAEYTTFFVAGESDNYQLAIGGYTGNMTDMMAYHNNMAFSTIDNDQDRYFKNCANITQAGWWFDECTDCNLNGRHVQDLGEDVYASLMWMYFYEGRAYPPLRTSVMKIK